MDIFIIITLIIAGIILLIIELFLIPGISIAGILSSGCLIYANYLAFSNMGYTTGFLTLGASTIACIGALAWFMHSKTLDRISLKTNITSKIDRSAEQKIKVGDTGTAITRLALIGNAEINNDIVEVRSADGLLDEKTPITVTRITKDTIFVCRNMQKK